MSEGFVAEWGFVVLGYVFAFGLLAVALAITRGPRP